MKKMVPLLWWGCPVQCRDLMNPRWGLSLWWETWTNFPLPHPSTAALVSCFRPSTGEWCSAFHPGAPLRLHQCFLHVSVDHVRPRWLRSQLSVSINAIISQLTFSNSLHVSSIMVMSICIFILKFNNIIVVFPQVFAFNYNEFQFNACKIRLESYEKGKFEWKHKDEA